MEKHQNSKQKLKKKFVKDEFEKKKLINFICQGIFLTILANLEICIL